MTILDLPTPALLIERDRVIANCQRMREIARSERLTLRPHVKTHKTLEGARLQLGGPTGPITVSTLREAEHFAANGFDDITLAVPLPPTRVERALALARRIPRLGLLIDDPAMLSTLEQTAKEHRARFSVWVEIDSGSHRTGLDPAASETLLFVRAVHQAAGLRFEGLITHAGHSYMAKTPRERAAISAEEVSKLSELRQRLRDLGVDVPVLSIGSTPTASMSGRPDGADEMRPGNYIFYDAWQAALGTCSIEDCAASVLTTVIAVYPQERRVVVDAGSLALTHEPPLENDGGWGIACDLDGNPLPMNVRRLSQEHGELVYTPLARPPAPAAWDESRSIGALRVGSRLRIIPNHSCITAAMFDRYYVVEKGSVVEEWMPVRGW